MGLNHHIKPADTPSIQELRIIIQGDAVESAQKTVEWAQRLARKLREDDLKKSQIRNIFSHVRQIEMSWPLDESEKDHAREANRALILLKPKLAYQAHRIEELATLTDVLSKGIDLVGENRANFQRFVDFFEAILAYHKAGEEK